MKTARFDNLFSFKLKYLFIYTLMPFPMLALEFLGLPICLLLETLLVCGLLDAKARPIAYIISASIIYLLYRDFQGFYKPEPMITFLALCSAFKFMYPKNNNDKVSRIVGIIWIAAFSLLKSDLTYFFFMIYSISFIFFTLEDSQTDKINPFKVLKIDKGNGLELVICLSIIILLFIFFPRYSNFLPKRNSSSQGKVGYSKRIDNSQIMNLQNSSQVAFTAETNRRLVQEKLYWRGRTHQRTDGFNWSQGLLKPERSQVELTTPITYIIKYEQNMGRDIILLDTPFRLTKSSLGYYKDRADYTYKLYTDDRKVVIEASSSLDGHIIADKRMRNEDNYLQLPGYTPKVLIQIITDLQLEGKPLEIVLRKFKDYLIKEKFSYSLAPGDVTTLTKFLSKKIGYCSHYASFLGILLRRLGFPTRLVSGFQGGTYNEIGGFYTIRSNDAHAWVEVSSSGKWNKIDPTGFIDPARINLGGELYFSTSKDERLTININKQSNFLMKFQRTWAFINYRMSLLIDSYDMGQQDRISKFLKVSKNLFYSIGVVLLSLFTLLYFFKPKYKKEHQSKVDKAFEKFIKKLNKNGLNILRIDSLDSIRGKIRISGVEKNSRLEKLLEIVDLYEMIKYAGLDSKEKQKEFLTQLKNRNIYQ